VNTLLGLGGGAEKDVDHMEGVNKIECETTCIACGRGERGKIEEWCVRRSGENGRGGCGARVQEKAWWCGQQDRKFLRKAGWRGEMHRSV